MKSNDQTLRIEITIAPARVAAVANAGRPGPKISDPPTIPRITRLMAVAIKFQDMVDRGEALDYADLAHLGYVTRARITQIMNLQKLTELGDPVQSAKRIRDAESAAGRGESVHRDDHETVAGVGLTAARSRIIAQSDPDDIDELEAALCGP